MISLFIIAALAIVLFVIIVIDIKYQVIPDFLNVAIALLAILNFFFLPHLSDALPFIISAVAMGGIGAFLAGPYSKWRGRDMLGWGDVKFLGAAGLWLPPEYIGWFLVVAGVCGTIFSLLYKAHTGRAEAPFAPSLCVALWAMVMLTTGLI